MAISDKTRKNLWAKCGNKCAICKNDLFPKSESKKAFNIGDECHIVSSKEKGPRHIPNIEDYDTIENLILLCRNHHKEVDDLPDTYTEDVLRYFKNAHENWVQKTLNSDLDSNHTEPRFLMLMNSGKELFNIVSNAHGYRIDYDEVKNEEEAEYVGGMIQSIVDYGEISSMVEPYDQVKMGFQLGEILTELKRKGYFVYAENSMEKVNFGGNNSWPIATLVIKKSTS